MPLKVESLSYQGHSYLLLTVQCITLFRVPQKPPPSRTSSPDQTTPLPSAEASSLLLERPPMITSSSLSQDDKASEPTMGTTISDCLLLCMQHRAHAGQYGLKGKSSSVYKDLSAHLHSAMQASCHLRRAVAACGAL